MIGGCAQFVTKTWLKDHDFKAIVWPPQSPNLNPIEHLWDHVKMKLEEHQEPPVSLQELWARVQEEWNDIGEGECGNLI